MENVFGSCGLPISSAVVSIGGTEPGTARRIGDQVGQGGGDARHDRGVGGVALGCVPAADSIR